MQEKPIWRILLVDDDEDDYLLTKTYLSEAKGRQCKLDWECSFTGGQHAVEQNEYDVILIDYDLGVPNGLEFIRLFVANDYPAPFILLSGRGSYDVNVEAMRAGATLYLTKVEINSLLLERSIQYAIEHKQIQRALADANKDLLFHQRELQYQNQLLLDEIAERKKIEEALRKSEATLRSVLDATKESIWLFDTDGYILLANDTALSRMNKPASEVIGRDYRELMPEDLANSRQARLREVMDTGQPVVFQDERAGMLFLHSFYPVKDKDGRVTGVTSYSRDITKDVQAEHEMREQGEMFRLALEAGQAGAWTWDLQQNIVQWSDTYFSLFGYEPGSVEPSLKAALSRVHPDDLFRVEEHASGLIEHGMQMDDIFRVVWPDGSIHWLRSIAQAFTNEQGRLYRLAGLISDRTEQVQAEIKLKEAHQQTVEILESIDDAFYSLDESLYFTYVNQRAGNLWGRDPQDLVGKQIWDVFPIFRETEAYTRINQAMRDRKPDQFETYSAYLDQWVEVHLYPSSRGLSVYFQNISERKKQKKT